MCYMLVSTSLMVLHAVAGDRRHRRHVGGRRGSRHGDGEDQSVLRQQHGHGRRRAQLSGSQVRLPDLHRRLLVPLRQPV